MKCNCTCLLLIVLNICTLTLYGQQPENDLQSWTMMAASTKLGQNYTSSLTIIHRVNDNISRYNDVSFDWRLKRKIQGGLSAQVVFRHWTFVKEKPIYFFWYDLIYVKKTESYRWINLLRFHHGLDWVGKEQADFLRWRNFYFHTIENSKTTLFFGYDLWYRWNGRNAFQNLWLDAGAEYKVSKFKFRLNYRRITHFDNQPGWKRNAIVTGVFYDI